MRVVGILVVLLLAVVSTTHAGELLEFEKKVRTPDPALRQLIRDARATSPTLRRLIARLERSDVIVYVTRHYDLPVQIEGQVTFMSRSGGHRYITVSLAWDRPARRMMATLAHELQHAVEIADDETVVDEASLARAYMRMGEPGALNVRSHQSFETQEAIAAGQTVWREYTSAHASAD